MNLHPNWKALHRNHMDQLKQMIEARHPQATEAKQLLREARAEYRRLLGLTKETDDAYVNSFDV